MKSAEAPQTLLYIAGYGRSGSTLLGRVLSLNPDVLDLGEVMTAPRFVDLPYYHCSCRQKFRDCPVWGPAIATIEPRHADFADRKTHLALLETIAAATDAQVLVDSSKTAGFHALMPFYLDRHLSFPLELVHLVRDPRAVLWSVFRSQKGGSRGSRTAIAKLGLALKVSSIWMMANLAAELFRIWRPKQTIRVRYDEALAKGLPGKLGSLVSQAPLEGMVFTAADSNCHAIGGNLMRNQQTVRIAQDEEWRSKLPAPLAAAVVVICLPLMIRYRFLDVMRPRAEPRMPAQKHDR